MTVAKGLGECEIRGRALGDPQVKPWLDGKELKQVIVVPGRLVNIVVK